MIYHDILPEFAALRINIFLDAAKPFEFMLVDTADDFCVDAFNEHLGYVTLNDYCRLRKHTFAIELADIL